MKSEASRNTDIFFDVLNASPKSSAMLKELHNSSVVFLPEDDRALAERNLEIGRRLPQGNIVYLAVSKSEGSQKYDTFQIKEPPIDL